MVWPGFELTTSHSADWQSCNSANQAVVMYCCSVWDGLTQTFKLQKLQNCAARVITKSRYDGSAGPLLDMLGWGSALISQIKQNTVVKCKTLNNQMPRTCKICSLFVTFTTISSALRTSSMYPNQGLTILSEVLGI